MAPCCPIGAMSVDVEEYFHAAALAPAAPRETWAGRESRVEAATDAVLDLFATAGVHATFFTLGSVAERHPRLIRRIAEAGHEVASHGYDHRPLSAFTPATFRADVARARDALEQAAGQAVTGFRAPNFSLDPGCWWAYAVLAETGHRYSSSINPVRHPHYGLPIAPLHPFAPFAGRPGTPGLVEVPMTAAGLPWGRFPASGGGVFRALPYRAFRALLNRAVRQGAVPVFYFHPWEVDPAQPRLAVPPRARLRHYLNLSGMAAKVARALTDFRWDRMDRAFATAIAGAALPVWAPGAAQDAREGYVPRTGLREGAA